MCQVVWYRQTSVTGQDSWKRYNDAILCWNKHNDRTVCWNRHNDRTVCWNRHNDMTVCWNRHNDRTVCWNRHNDKTVCWNRHNDRTVCWNSHNDRTVCWNRHNETILCWNRQTSIIMIFRQLSIPIGPGCIDTQKLMTQVVLVVMVAERAEVTSHTVPTPPQHSVEVALSAGSAACIGMTHTWMTLNCHDWFKQINKQNYKTKIMTVMPTFFQTLQALNTPHPRLDKCIFIYCRLTVSNCCFVEKAGGGGGGGGLTQKNSTCFVLPC